MVGLLVVTGPTVDVEACPIIMGCDLGARRGRLGGGEM